jgi:hypothetical protein
MEKWYFSKKYIQTRAILEIIPQITEERITFSVVTYLTWPLTGHGVQQLTFKQISLLTPYLFLAYKIIIIILS